MGEKELSLYKENDKENGHFSLKLKMTLVAAKNTLKKYGLAQEFLFFCFLKNASFFSFQALKSFSFQLKHSNYFTASTVFKQ